MLYPSRLVDRSAGARSRSAGVRHNAAAWNSMRETPRHRSYHHVGVAARCGVLLDSGEFDNGNDNELFG